MFLLQTTTLKQPCQLQNAALDCDGKIKIQGKSEEVAVNPVAKEFYLGKDFSL